MAFNCIFLFFAPLILFGFQASGAYYQRTTCRPTDVQIYQHAIGFGDGHVPRYTATIINENPQSRALSDVHVNCGDFASTSLVNPKIFRRLSPGDCLVKDGQTLEPMEIIVFDYTNLFSYKLIPSSVKCS